MFLFLVLHTQKSAHYRHIPLVKETILNPTPIKTNKNNKGGTNMQVYINNNVEATKSDVNELTKDGKIIISAIYYRINGREVLVIKTNN